MNSLGVAAFSLAVFVLFRIGARPDPASHFGSWKSAPPWARSFFGANEGVLSPYDLSAQLTALVWLVGGLLSWFGGDPPATPWRQLIGGTLLLALLACFVAWVIAFLGEQRRLG